MFNISRVICGSVNICKKDVVLFKMFFLAGVLSPDTLMFSRE